MKKIYAVLISVFFASTNQLMAQACTGTPANNTVVSSATNVCVGTTLTLSLQNAYTATGIVYQWATGTSSVGPWTAINGANAASLITNTLTQSAWYTSVIACTNSFMSATATAVYVAINATSATTTTPYFENFEAPMSNGMPNCSWSASSLGINCLSFSTTIPGAIPYSGTRMLGFSYSLSTLGTHEFYSQGLTLQPSIVYSVAVHQSANYYANANNWSSFGLGIGPSQSVTNGTVVYSTSSPIVGPYTTRSATFTVGSAGVYYVRLFATSVSGASVAQFLTFDDLSVTVPCNISPNSASVSLAPSSSVICSAPIVTVNLLPAPNCTVAGGTTYTVNSANFFPNSSFTMQVLVTNSLTGCSDLSSLYVTLFPSPIISASPFPIEICEGKTISVFGIGGNSYTLNPGGIQFSSTTSVSPNVSTNFTVQGVNGFGCKTTTNISATVNPKPVINLSQNSVTICKKESFTLTASGATVYNVGTNFYTSVISIPILNADSTFQIIGTDINGCQNTANLVVKVSDCAGIPSLVGDAAVAIFPNPNTGTFKIVLAKDASVKIRDLSGRLIYTTDLKAGAHSIQQNELSRGLYIIEVQTDGGLTKKQLVID